jgi:hypothetical protein
LLFKALFAFNEICDGLDEVVTIITIKYKIKNNDNYNHLIIEIIASADGNDNSDG